MTKQEKLKQLVEITRSNKFTPEKLKDILLLLNDNISKDDFFDSIKKVMVQVLKIESKAVEAVSKSVLDLKSQNNTILQATQADLRQFQDELEQSIKEAIKEQENGLNFIRDKVRNLKNGQDGKDGKDADEKLIIEAIMKSIKIPEINTAEIDKLKAELDEVKKELEMVKSRKGGGGTSAMGVRQTFKNIAHTEKPAGLINGANKIFTVENDIWWVAGFTINNQVIAELPNFTYAGKTITFDQAIPSVYATKDFEIKYIG